MTTKEQVKEWVREECARLEREKRDTCDHLISGSMRGGLLFCDHCGKQLDFDDAYINKEPGQAELDKIEQRQIDRARGKR